MGASWDCEIGSESQPGSLRRRIVIVAFPRVNLLDVAGPCEVFSSLSEALGEEATAGGYTVEVVTTTRGSQIESSSGVGLVAARHCSSVRGVVDTLLIAGGTGVWAAMKDEAFLSWLRRAGPKVRRVGSICTGAFVLAASGWLDGRRATTHWRWCDRLAREYPAVAVEPDSIFVRDGNLHTSAGVTAGIDLALALVEEDLGREVALAIARHLVMFVHRPGGQSQFSPLLELQAANRRPLRDLQAWVAEHLAEDLSVDILADRAHMSPRNFARAFHKEVGWTPARFVERLRVDAARRRLEETDAGLERVARECGFGSADVMRRSFLRVLQVAPSDYRGRFQASSAS
ncbi:transcriptional regulator, AraC family with amidase-like domain [Singulisphaera sp. GP187]|uniref:GlxA family transcriptional regulator n=1 Tax=Singulisphaera sp. GP187 TaxID=1882752 RepID=UPI0009275CB4|nr:GlxA family transcriptional regulator [Singulisphaera sp. GP187]SIN95879.1 transcriptional regulator, AraC family with amidase-like domain [Singulisphaera sp. GP187]